MFGQPGHGRPRLHPTSLAHAMDWMWNVGIVAVLIVAAVVAQLAFRRRLARTGGRRGTGGSAGFGDYEAVPASAFTM